MPRILVISGRFPANSETFIISHVDGMRSRGWDVAVAANTLDYDLLQKIFGSQAPRCARSTGVPVCIEKIAQGN